MRGTVNKILTPVMLPTIVPLAHDYISKMITCSRENRGSAQCPYLSSALPCTVFRRCDDINECLKSRNASAQVPDSDYDKEND